MPRQLDWDEAALNFAELKGHYLRYPIVLYTGAGVSIGDEQRRFGLPGWLDLLREVLTNITGLNSVNLSAKLPDDPWMAADHVIRRCGGKRNFQKALTSIVQANENYTVSQRQLSRSFLTVAPTLNAVAAFCARLRGRVQIAKDVRYDIGSNPRVRAVLTSNYDPFLEAAFSTKFIKPLLKPVAAYGSHVGNLAQIPVFHIHGYVPHPAQRQRLGRKPLVARLVLSRDDYARAWDSSNAFGTTMTPQIHFLRHYTILFVGFSFADKYVCKLLEKIRLEYSQPPTSDRKQHFAMIPISLFKQHGNNYFRRIGVRPIVYKHHQDVPSLLGDLYLSALTKEYPAGEVPLAWVNRHSHKVLQQHGSVLKPDQYWQALLSCRNGALPLSSANSAPRTAEA